MAAVKEKSYLELIEECDNFPYPEFNPGLLDSYYHFYLLKTWSQDETRLQCVGYMLPEVVAAMPWTPHFRVDHTNRLVTIPFNAGTTESAALAEQLALARARDAFAVLRGWRDELYPIAGLAGRAAALERAGSPLFGIATFGVHLTAFVRGPTLGGAAALRVWVPRRAAAKTYGGLLDNSVAGGIAAGEAPLASLLREAAEEASLPADLVQGRARAAGTVSYVHVRDARAGGETGLLQPETQFVYDLELEPGTVLRPADDEVQEFYLWELDRVVRALRAGELKPNCALVLIDFLVRHGWITAENEPQFLDIVPRMHRRISFGERTLGP